LYYFIYFDIREYNWTIILAGETKPVRIKIKEFLETQNVPNFFLEESLSGGHDIGYRVISSNPDFRKPDELKKEIIDRSLEFINEMNAILAKYKTK
jgi:glutaredoxin-related protein